MVRLAWLGLTACGRLGFEPLQVVDADGTGDGTAADASPLGPFGVESMIDVAGQADNVSLTDDELELYFDSKRLGSNDVWVATRADRQSPFGPPVAVSELNTTNREDEHAHVSGDGLTLYLSSNRAAVTNFDLYISTRAARGDLWSTPVVVAELNSSSNDESAVPTSDPLLLLVASNRAGANLDLLTATRTTISSPWNTPVPVTELNTSVLDSSPWLDPAGVALYFTSERPGAGGRDLWVASRPTPGSPFDPPTQVAGLDTTDDESDAWLTTDQRTIYFVRETINGQFVVTATR